VGSIGFQTYPGYCSIQLFWIVNPIQIEIVFSKWIDNPIIFGKRYGIANIFLFFDKTMEFPRDIFYQLTSLQINKLFENFDKK